MGNTFFWGGGGGDSPETGLQEALIVQGYDHLKIERNPEAKIIKGQTLAASIARLCVVCVYLT